ncbi:MAG: hypothetical protein ACXV0U_11835, partial [Kineosporiaceae bacterium]
MTDAETPPEQGRDRRPPPDAARTAPMAVDGPPPDAVGPARPPPTGGPEAETRVAGPCTVAGADEVAVPGPDREPVPADRPDGGSDELDGVRDGPDAENGAGTRASASEGSVVEAAAATSEPVPATSEAPLPPPDVAPAAVSETLPSAGDSPHVGAESVPRAPETVPTEREAAGATAQAPPTAADPVPAAPDPVPAAPDPVPATPDPVPATPDPVPATPDPGRSPAGQLLPGDPRPHPHPPRAVARGRLRRAMRPRATRAQLLAGALCALLGFALVVQARQTQVQGLDSLRQADLVRVLDNVTNAEARAEQD